MKSEEFLKELGFTNLSGCLWKHKKYGILMFANDDTIAEIVNKIYERGWNSCQSNIKEALGIGSK